MAQERLSEANKLSEVNDTENADKAIQMHTKAMQRAEQTVQNLPEERRANASQKLNSARNQSVSVLENLKQRIPESAMNGIDTALEAHMNKGVGKISDNRSDQKGNRTQGSKDSEVDRGREIVVSGYKATSRVVRD